MKRLLSTINKRPNASPPRDEYPQNSPESIVLREVTAFCEKGQGPDQPQGDEFVHLPSIVESAESSPNAAREAAHLLRKLLSSRNSTAPNVQYNAIMLLRILIDNPGYTFTRNLDAKFVGTVKDSLRTGKDMGVQRFLRETLEAMEMQRAWDEDLKPLVEMWKKEKAKMDKAFSGHSRSRTGSWRSSPSRQNSDNQFVRPERTDALPPPDELVSRISEAKTSAKLLLQFVQSTPPTEMASNDLIQEFSGRCRRASRAISNYIHATNPPPDEDTLLTLIETNDELSVALSKHQRAMLQARKALGQQTPPEPASATHSPEASDQSGAAVVPPAPVPVPATRPVPPPPVPLRARTDTPPLLEPVSPVSPDIPAHRSGTTKTERSDVSVASNPGPGPAARYEYRSEDYQVQNPFADPTGPVHPDDERDRWTGTGLGTGTQQPAPGQHHQH